MENGSELDVLCPPQIEEGSKFYSIIQRIASQIGIRTILEIGSSSGEGSTQALVSGMQQNPGSPFLYCIEVSKPRFVKLQERYDSNLHVKTYNVSSVSLEKFPTEQKVCSFYSSVESTLNLYSIERVLGWLRQDIEYVVENNIPDGGIQLIKRENNINAFDMVMIDGSEFTGNVEVDELYGAKFILLDDINSYKTFECFQRLSDDSGYKLIVEERNDRNGFAVFKRIDLPQISVGMIVFNADLFLKTCLDAICDFAHEILIVEGSCPQARWDASSEGTSRDRTLEVISSYPDIENKIKLVASQAWNHKDDMVNAYIPYVTGDYLFQVDSDEIWSQDALKKIHQVLCERPDITCLEFNPLHFWHNFETVLVEGHWVWPFMRIFRFEKGAKWQSHEPPILLNPQGVPYNDIKKVNATDEFGIRFFHYSYLTERQARWKATFFKQYSKPEDIRSSDASTCIGMTSDWFEKVWKAWENNPEMVETTYGTSPGGGPAWGPQGRTEKYTGSHPEVITLHPLWRSTKEVV